MESKKRTNVPIHPLASGSFINWIKLLLTSGGIDKKYMLRAFQVSLLSLVVSPFIFLEEIIFGKKIEDLQINYPPIFIIGHWRSGTTFLFNLMMQDKNLGYLSFFQAYLPNIFPWNLKVSKTIFNKLLYEKRPMDNIAISIDSPEEEEFALGNRSNYCFFHGFYFPKKIKMFFTQFVLFEGVPEQVRIDWKKIYTKLLKKVTLNANGKRLVLKNPVNTARVKILLEIFPDAKFIYIYREPYTVYASTKQLYEKLILSHLTFQDISKEEMEENIIFIYQKLMQEFFNSRDAIPPGNLVEVKYEDLQGNELRELKRIYSELNLPGFEQAEEDFKNYIASQLDYKKNQHSLDKETIKKINQEWKLTFEKWQYDVQ